MRAGLTVDDRGPRRRGRARLRGATFMSRLFALVVGVPFFLIGVGSLLESGPGLFFGAVTLVAVVFMVLGLRTGVFVGAGEVRLRGWWYSVRLAAGDELVVVPYSSLWNWGADSAIFSMLALRRGSWLVPLQATVGPVLRVRRLARLIDECRGQASSDGSSHGSSHESSSEPG